MVGEASNDGACGDSGFKRVNYFSGVLLSERDFLGEQSYNSEKRKLHNRLLHGWGVVCGLKVLPTSPPSRRVIIEPGLAIDCAGNEILVPGPCELDVVAAAAVGDPGRESDGEGRDGEAMGRLREFCVSIEYRETPTDPVPVLGAANDGGSAAKYGYSRVSEGYRFDLVRECALHPPCPEQHRPGAGAGRGAHAWARELPHRCPLLLRQPDCCGNPHVVLGVIRLEGEIASGAAITDDAISDRTGKPQEP